MLGSQLFESGVLDSATKVLHKFEVKLSNYDKPKDNVEHIDTHLQVSSMAGLIDTQCASNYIHDISDPLHNSKTLVCRTKFREEHIDVELIKQKTPFR